MSIVKCNFINIISVHSINIMLQEFQFSELTSVIPAFLYIVYLISAVNKIVYYFFINISNYSKSKM